MISPVQSKDPWIQSMGYQKSLLRQRNRCKYKRRHRSGQGWQSTKMIVTKFQLSISSRSRQKGVPNWTKNGSLSIPVMHRAQTEHCHGSCDQDHAVLWAVYFYWLMMTTTILGFNVFGFEFSCNFFVNFSVSDTFRFVCDVVGLTAL